MDHPGRFHGSDVLLRDLLARQAMTKSAVLLRLINKIKKLPVADVCKALGGVHESFVQHVINETIALSMEQFFALAALTHYEINLVKKHETKSLPEPAENRTVA